MQMCPGISRVLCVQAFFCTHMRVYLCAVEFYIWSTHNENCHKVRFRFTLKYFRHDRKNLRLSVFQASKFRRRASLQELRSFAISCLKDRAQMGSKMSTPVRFHFLKYYQETHKKRKRLESTIFSISSGHSDYSVLSATSRRKIVHLHKYCSLQ